MGANAGTINYYDGECGITDNTLIVKPTNQDIFNCRYVFHYLKFKGLNKYVFGSGQPLITGAMLKKLSISYGEESEMNKIVSLLDTLDQRISIQNKTIAHYESLIRALYCKVFSLIKGNRVLLSEIVQIQKGKQINGEDLSDTGRYYVMNGGVVPSGYYDQYNTEANTISISEGGNSCGYVQYNIEPFWSGGHCYSLLNPSSEIDYKFLYHFLKYHQDDIMSLRIGSGLPNIQKKDIERFPVTLPSFSEQVRYTKVFDAISSLVTTEKQILEQLIMRKDYLIQNLFI